ncbi:AAA family ATPase [Bosea sp. RAC05]|uniref:AAA family ATPase n=1 Tax=Bosea sp. RAC05 TaxID=1842539 RepID=UPI0014960F59|nr:AAA family ATPase [Bosea sp. RAC05]
MANGSKCPYFHVRRIVFDCLLDVKWRAIVIGARCSQLRDARVIITAEDLLSSWRRPHVFTTAEVDQVYRALRDSAVTRNPALADSLLAVGVTADIAYAIACEPASYGVCEEEDIDEVRCWMWLAAQKGRVEAIEQMVAITQACALSSAFEDERDDLEELSASWLTVLEHASPGSLKRVDAIVADHRDPRSPASRNRGRTLRELAEAPHRPATPQPAPAMPPDAEFGAVVVPYIGDPQSREGVDLGKRYGTMVGRKLPFKGVLPAPGAIGNAIRQRWPWADLAAHRIETSFAVLRAAEVDRPIVLPPMLFVGPPGSGKSTLARFVCELAGLATTVLPLGGVSDGAGVSAVTRSWATSRPSAIALGMCQHDTANPAYVLEEIDKTSKGNSSNGSASDALLQLVGSQSYQDLCLMAPVNVAHVTFIATANNLQGVPHALRDRFKVIVVPPPRDEDFETLLATVTEDFIHDRGIRRDRMPRLTAQDIMILRRWFEQNRSARAFADAFESIVSSAIAEFEALDRTADMPMQ